MTDGVATATTAESGQRRVVGGHALAVALLLDEGTEQVGLRREGVVDRGDIEPAGAGQTPHRRACCTQLADEGERSGEDACPLAGLGGGRRREVGHGCAALAPLGGEHGRQVLQREHQAGVAAVEPVG
ncbi:MAG TPA: hypothetical protein VH479_21695, partial [Acidimicrobiales bacterium]